ncbi:hypothetical protein B7P43_G07377 [Cryptotermes secundus]|uniref:Uncharacterized protein n=1 Tax=Cryptotermes secundus TaxID=105785 RepID=A0A2J7PMT3_9NEOP|nr:hypothetical protein B7P43_G07377 [Cryptotermes secundus]
MDKVQKIKGRKEQIKKETNKQKKQMRMEKLKSKEREGKMQLRHASNNSSRNVETSTCGRRLKRESDVGDLT